MTQIQALLIAGLPRSGTTWVGEVFSSARNTYYIFEPDNEGLSPLAWLCKKDIHRFPYLTSRDESASYHQLWQTVIAGKNWTWPANNALGLIFRKKAAELEAYVGIKSGLIYVDKKMRRVGGNRVKAYRVEERPIMAFLTKQLLVNADPPRQDRRIVIKSVHASLSMDWISNHFPVQTVLVLRNPYSLYTSYKRMKMPDSFRNLLFQENLRRDILELLPDLERVFIPEQESYIAFQIMLMYKIIEKQITIHPEWTLISHDRLCLAPQDGYHHVFSKLNLIWSGETEQKINALNKQGKGFEPKRVSILEPAKWKSEMSVDEQKMIDRWINIFGLCEFFQEHVNLE
jgi:hypothetical protein